LESAQPYWTVCCKRTSIELAKRMENKCPIEKNTKINMARSKALNRFA